MQLPLEGTYTKSISKECLQSAYNVPGTILSILYALAHLILTATKIIIIPNSMYKKTETEILSNLLEVITASKYWS